MRRCQRSKLIRNKLKHQPDLRNQQQLTGTKKMRESWIVNRELSEGWQIVQYTWRFFWFKSVGFNCGGHFQCLKTLLAGGPRSPAIVCCSSCFPGCAELLETLISWVRHLCLICDKQFGTHRWYIQQTRSGGESHHLHRPGLILQQCEVIYVSI